MKINFRERPLTDDIRTNAAGAIETIMTPIVHILSSVNFISVRFRKILRRFVLKTTPMIFATYSSSCYFPFGDKSVRSSRDFRLYGGTMKVVYRAPAWLRDSNFRALSLRAKSP